MNSAQKIDDRNAVQSSFSILLAGTNSILRETIAGILTRQEKAWWVVQVSGRQELLRGAVNIQPDFILASISLLNDPKTINTLKETVPCCRIVALADSVSEPYRRVIQSLGLTDVIETTAVDEYFVRIFDALNKKLRNSI